MRVGYIRCSELHYVTRILFPIHPFSAGDPDWLYRLANRFCIFLYTYISFGCTKIFLVSNVSLILQVCKVYD